MDVNQQSLNAVECSPSSAKSSKTKNQKHDSQSQPSLYLTNAVFFGIFFSVAYFLLHRWREKIRTSTPLHVLTISEIVAVLSLIASIFYLTAFFSIAFILHPFAVSRAVQYDEEDEADIDKTT
ncbi:hypothetical protein RYX36_004029, partial [Vicia faba]